MSRPRIRTLKPELWQDEAIGHASVHARLLFIGLITMADDEGRLRALPAAVIGHVFPYDDVNATRLAKWMTELQDANLIVVYAANDTPYVQIKGWQHQKINRPTVSKLPAPSVRTHGFLPDPSLRVHVQHVEDSPPRAHTRVGADRIGSDQESGSPVVEGRANSRTSPPPDLAEEIRGILQRGLDGLTAEESGRPPSRSAIAAALEEHQPAREDALAVAVEVRSIAQSQNRAPNIARLYATRLAAHGGGVAA